jgi:hypothetical protein
VYRSLVLVVVLTFSFLANRAAAAEPQPEDPTPRDPPRDGVHVSFTGAFGVTSFTEQAAQGRRSAPGEGPATTILVGTTVGRGVILGGGIHSSFPAGTFEDGGSVSADTQTVGPFVEWYPAPMKSGWHLAALAGAGVARLQTPASSETSGVLGVTSMAGYDWWILPDWSLEINATASASAYGFSLDATSSGSGSGSGARYRIAPLSAGFEVGLAFH